jgi:hypothetical protein
MQLPPGTILGKPTPGFVLPPGARPLPPGARPLPPGARPLPPGARPLPPGARPPGGIPPHLLLGRNASGKPVAKKGELYLPEDYNNLEIPKLDVGKFLGIKQDKLAPVPVLVFLNIRSIREIDETESVSISQWFISM